MHAILFAFVDPLINFNVQGRRKERGRLFTARRGVSAPNDAPPSRSRPAAGRGVLAATVQVPTRGAHPPGRAKGRRSRGPLTDVARPARSHTRTQRTHTHADTVPRSDGWEPDLITAPSSHLFNLALLHLPPLNRIYLPLSFCHISSCSPVPLASRPPTWPAPPPSHRFVSFPRSRDLLPQWFGPREAASRS